MLDNVVKIIWLPIHLNHNFYLHSSSLVCLLLINIVMVNLRKNLGQLEIGYIFIKNWNLKARNQGSTFIENMQVLWNDLLTMNSISLKNNGISILLSLVSGLVLTTKLILRIILSLYAYLILLRTKVV